MSAPAHPPRFVSPVTPTLQIETDRRLRRRAQPAPQHPREAVGEAARVEGALAVEDPGFVEQCAASSLKFFSSSPRPASETMSGCRGFTSRIGFAAVAMLPAPPRSFPPSFVPRPPGTPRTPGGS
jgi:hypothetical protein